MCRTTERKALEIGEEAGDRGIRRPADGEDRLEIVGAEICPHFGQHPHLCCSRNALDEGYQGRAQVGMVRLRRDGLQNNGSELFGSGRCSTMFGELGDKAASPSNGLVASE